MCCLSVGVPAFFLREPVLPRHEGRCEAEQQQVSGNDPTASIATWMEGKRHEIIAFCYLYFTYEMVINHY